MRLRNVKFCREWSIVSTKGSTIERKTRINRRDYERRKCGASNQEGMLNAFFPPSVPFTHELRNEVVAELILI